MGRSYPRPKSATESKLDRCLGGSAVLHGRKRAITPLFTVIGRNVNYLSCKLHPDYQGTVPVQHYPKSASSSGAGTAKKKFFLQIGLVILA